MFEQTRGLKLTRYNALHNLKTKTFSQFNKKIDLFEGILFKHNFEKKNFSVKWFHRDKIILMASIMAEYRKIGANERLGEYLMGLCCAFVNKTVLESETSAIIKL